MASPSQGARPDEPALLRADPLHRQRYNITLMDLMLKGKVAIVGGASKGLGRACAQALAEEGVNLAICSRSQADLEKAAQEIRSTTGVEVLAFAGDLDHHDTIRNLVADAVDRFGRLDVLVSNSGGPP